MMCSDPQPCLPPLCGEVIFKPSIRKVEYSGGYKRFQQVYYLFDNLARRTLQAQYLFRIVAYDDEILSNRLQKGGHYIIDGCTATENREKFRKSVLSNIDYTITKTTLVKDLF